MHHEKLLSNLTLPELLRDSWKDKGGREVDARPLHTLVIKVNRPQTTPREITNAVMETIATEAFLHPEAVCEWIAQWGRVIVSPGRDITAKFTRTDSYVSKSAPIVSTDQVIEISPSPEPPPNNGPCIWISDKVKTTQGVAIATSHLVEELILRSKLTLEAKGSDQIEALQVTINSLQRSGIWIRALNQDLLVDLWRQSPNRRFIKLHGSRKTNLGELNVLGMVQVPKCGNSYTPISLRNPGPKVNFSGKRVIAISENNSRASEQKEIDCGNCVVMVAISGGKPLHLGHALLLTKAQLIAEKMGGKIIVRNNNTGPRVEHMVSTASRSMGMSTKEVVRKLKNRAFSPQEIETFWKMREDSRSPLDPTTAKKLIDFDVFGPVTEINKRVAENLLPGALWINENDLVREALPVQEDLVWQNSGFTTVRGENDKVFVLESQGRLTANGNDALVIKKISELSNEKPVIFVDSAPVARAGVRAANALAGKEIARSTHGLGLMIGSEPASGSQRNCLSIQEAIKIVGTRKLRMGLKSMLRDWVLIDGHPNDVGPRWIWTPDISSFLETLNTVTDVKSTNRVNESEISQVPKDNRRIAKIRHRIENNNLIGAEALLNVYLTHTELFPIPDLLGFLNQNGFLERVEVIDNCPTGTINRVETRIKENCLTVLWDIWLGKKHLIRGDFANTDFV